jgi:hypothetical protein
MIHFSTAIVPDTVWGALVLSVFDFIACFFVLYFISFFIRGITYFDEKPLPPPEDHNKLKEENESYRLPLIK